MSKKDLSKEMFGAGVYLAINAFIDSMTDIKKMFLYLFFR